jgi:flavin reductase (DIM6/NTAB) family NADH-FMN oxidoreductase RutF
MQAVIQAFPEPDTKLAHTAAQPGKPADTRALRNCLGQMATGVTVVSTRTHDGAFIGLTCNSFAALSLDPPLVTWSLRLTSPSLPAFQHAPHFVVNVLAEAQLEISRRFASSVANRFEGVAHAKNAHGMPLLHGASAWFECRTISSQTAGDHCLFIAEVEHFSSSEAAPLLFHGGGYFALGSRL